MLKLPKFSLYGEGNPVIEENIQPELNFRRWSELSNEEKEVAYQQISNKGWLERYSPEILNTIEYLNYKFLRQCPGKHLHSIKPERGYSDISTNEFDREDAALVDFKHIFINESSDAMVFRMLSSFISCHIDMSNYESASKSKDKKECEKLINKAFKKFDNLANCLNHIFEQFAINQVVTRNGFVPRQDKKIINKIYKPTLQALANPRWKSVSNDLARMFENYQNEHYPETITKAHVAMQRFLQILTGKEGKNSKGEISKLFQEAKSKGLISVNRFTEPLINSIQAFIVSERANNSTAKPTLKKATSSDALLVMNVVIVFLQHCLQSLK